MPIQKIEVSANQICSLQRNLVDFKENFWVLGSFAGIGIIAYMQSKTLPHSDVVYLIGSFGASCVLIYGVIQSL
jgi:hypothetical protein